MSRPIPPAYARIQDSEYMEVFGLDFGQFEIGQKFQHRPGVTLSAQDITDESLDTLNAAQIHYDANYASKTEFGRPLGVSTLTLQKCFGMTWKTFARKDRIVSLSSIAMKKPVYAGTTLYAETTVSDVTEADTHCGVITARTDAVNEDGETVASVDYQIRVFKKVQHPYYGSLDIDFDVGDSRFAAYRAGENGALTEQTGLFYDDFEVGEIFHHKPGKFTHVSESLEHARRSMDWNPRFTDPGFAKEHFGDTTAPLTEMYAIGALTASTTRTFGRVVANLAWRNVSSRRLVYPGEGFRTQSQILEKKDSRSRPDQGILTVLTTAYDSDDREVLSFERVLLVYKRNCGPYADGGY